MLYYSETHSTSNSAKKEIKFNTRLAKNTQCSNSRFNPLKLPQTYNPTQTHRKWLRMAVNIKKQGIHNISLLQYKLKVNLSSQNPNSKFQ